jgi:RNA polymerase sigma-70 factor (ECF subfamily)
VPRASDEGAGHLGSSAGDETALLVRSAQRGDREAYGELYRRFGPLVHGVLLAHAPEDDVRDLVHDVFLHAMSRLATIRDPMAFGAWLAQIARNMAKMKSRSRLKLVSLGESLVSERPSPDAALDAQRVLVALRSLPEAYRETLLLRLVEGMSGGQIAERTGLTPGSVRVNLHRGMEMLRTKLGGAA